MKLFERTVFSFLVGNEDMHLKNFSLSSRQGRTELSPAYDFLNSTIALANPREDLALPLNGKKSELTPEDIVDYFGRHRLQLNERLLTDVMARFMGAFPKWDRLLEQCFLSNAMKQNFREVLGERRLRLRI